MTSRLPWALLWVSGLPGALLWGLVAQPLVWWLSVILMELPHRPSDEEERPTKPVDASASKMNRGRGAEDFSVEIVLEGRVVGQVRPCDAGMDGMRVQFPTRETIVCTLGQWTTDP